MRSIVILAETRLGAGWPPPEESGAFYHLLATCERPLLWESLISPLKQELEASGLGRIPDLDSLQRNAAKVDRIASEEIVIQLAHLAYGRELVERVIHASGVLLVPPMIPPRWSDYSCDEYFTHDWWKRGYFAESELWLIGRLQHVRESADIAFLSVGTSGCNGIDFGYRKEHPGLWAYSPVPGRFQKMAETIPDLIEGWCSGRLIV